MMNSLKRKLFLALLFVVLLTALSLLSAGAQTYVDDATAVAAGAVARVGDAGTGTYYSSLPDAIAAAPDGGTVTLIADSAISASLNLTKSITLAGNGVISTSAASTHAIVLGGNVRLAVTGNVEVKATGSGSSAIYQETSANTEVVLSGNAKVTSSYWTINYKNNAGTTATVKVSISDNATVTGQYCITINNNFLLKLTMTGGTINATAKDGVYVDSTDTATKLGNEISISGGEIKAKGNGFNLKGKSSIQMTMTGGSVTSDYGVFIQGTASIALSMTGGAISASRGICVASKGVCRLELLGGSVTGSKDAAVWLNPVGNTKYTDLTLIVDGATLTGGYFAICCQGYTNNSAAIAYMTVIIQESDPAKPTVLSITTVAPKNDTRTIRMVDGSQVDLQISGGSFSSTGDSIIYGSNVLGYTKLTLSGGNFTPGTTEPTHVFLNLGRTMDVILSGSFNTGEGQTGSFGKATHSIFCQGGITGGTNITTTADITASNVIFRCQLGTINVTINGGKLSSTTTISYTTYANKQGGISNITINGGELTTNNKANMFDARAGEMNIYVYGGIIRDGKYLFSYWDFASDETNPQPYYAKGETVIDMSSGYISTKSSIFVGWCSGEGNLRVIKGNITCTTTANEMYMFARWGAPKETGGTATSEIIIEGGNFNFTNKGKTPYTAVVGVKDTSSAVVTISGGNLDGGNYGVRALAGARLDLKVTGGTITACTATKDGTTQPGSVIYSKATITNITFTGGKAVATDASCNGINIKKGTTATIKMGGTAEIDVKGYGIINGSGDNDTIINLTITGGSIRNANICMLLEAPNGEMNVNIYSGFYSAVNGFLRIGANVKASTVNIYGGVVSQPFNAGGNVIYNTNTETTINLYGLSAFGGRTMITNKGKGTPSTKPGESLGATYSVGAPVMSYGAGVRLTEGSSGLRFVSAIDGDTVAALNALADKGTVSFGTLIFPASYLDGLTSYTHGTIPKYLDIAAVNGLIPDGNGGYTIRAAIVNLKAGNYDRAFVAIAYVKYEVDGVLCYRYSALQELQTARSMAQIARLALLDTKDSQSGSYIYESTVGKGFSKYNAAQQAVLAAYHPDLTVKTIDVYMITGQSNGSGYSHFGSEFKTDNTKYTAGFSNVLYSGYACSATGSNPLRWGTLTPVPTTAGFGRDGNYIGAELGLAEALSAYYNTETGKTAAILKYADGGTFLSDNVGGSSARQGNWTSPSYLAAHGKTDEILSGNLYRNFIALVEDTVAYYQLLGYDVNLCGIFWMQGCSERNYYNGIPALGNEPAVASPTVEQVNALYTTLFRTMVADMRSDLGKITGQDLSAMPVIAGSISEAFGNIQSQNQTNFVNMQAKMVRAEDHTYLLGETRYLVTGTDSGDSAHYSVDDMVFAGQKLGETFLTLGGHGAYIRKPTEQDYVAKVFDGSTYSYYTNLAYAINTAPEGAVVYQLKDVNLYGPLNIATFSKGVIFDGNGFTIHSYSLGHAMKIIGAATNITLNNVRLINHRDNVNNAYAVYMYAGATLNITGNNTYFESYRYGIVVNLVSTVNISGGTFTTRNGQEIGSAAVYVGSASTVNITGGSFKGVNKGAAFHINNAAATVTISGGTFTPGTSATYAINNASADATLAVRATVTPGTMGSVYNAGSGTATH